jgi:hypothetical protein
MTAGGTLAPRMVDATARGSVRGIANGEAKRDKQDFVINFASDRTLEGGEEPGGWSVMGRALKNERRGRQRPPQEEEIRRTKSLNSATTIRPASRNIPAR